MPHSPGYLARARQRLSLPVLCVCAALLPATSACDSKPSGTTPAASASVASAPASASGPSAKSSASAAASSNGLNNAKPKAYKHTDEQTLGTLPEGVGIAVGQKAPDFELPNSTDGKVSLKEVLAKGPALLVFYRGGW